MFRNLIPLVFATPSIAQEIPSGCYFRDYSDAHLSQNPGQGVDEITIFFRPSNENAGGIVLADVHVVAANQGQMMRDGVGGLELLEIAGNFNAPLRFGVECDGGFFDVIDNTGEALTIQTPGMRLSTTGGCGGERGVTTLAEQPGAWTTYRLMAADQAICDERF